MATRNVNKNVSSSAVSRSEKVIISELVVINEVDAPKKPGVLNFFPFLVTLFSVLRLLIDLMVYRLVL